MDVRRTLLISAGLLLMSVPAWGDSIHSKSTYDFNSSGSSVVENVVGSNDASGFAFSDFSRFGDFNAGDSDHRHWFDDGRGWRWDRDWHHHRGSGFGGFCPPSGTSGGSPTTPSGPSSSDPIGTPEPGTLALLVSGLCCVGLIFYRRNAPLIRANVPAM